MDDLISRQAAIDAVLWGITHAKAINKDTGDVIELFKQGNEELTKAVDRIKELPSAQQTLFGYKIEHLAYIARVMEKDGVTAECAVKTFDDISRAVRMILEEAQQKAEEMLYERFN